MTAIGRRLRTLLKELGSMTLGSLIIAVRPLLLVRIGNINSGRIGEFAIVPETVLCEADQLPADNSRKLDIWYEQSRISNAALQLMWRRVLRVGPRAIWDPTRRFLVGRNAFAHVIETDGRERDRRDAMFSTEPHLSFSPTEIEEAKHQLAAFGLPADAAWVCVHSRDDAYLASIYPDTSWAHHDYRDSDIDTFVAAAEVIADRGLWVFRMGATAAKPMQSRHPRVIDYATGGRRTDLLDVYLAAHCHFFLSTGSGIDEVAGIFRRPQLYVNFVPVAYAQSWKPRSMVMFKKHLDLRGNQLSMREVNQRGAAHALRSEIFADSGIELRDNTSEEIRDAALDMLDYLAGHPIDTSAQSLNHAFWLNFPLDRELSPASIRTMIPPSYLRSNPLLLGTDVR
jgi:putative glycosyltransferase (TIGR04372 family)